MAIDHAIMEAVGTGKTLPTLRFYAWEPTCLSLGYNQASQEVDFERLQRHGWEVVRRATGGKAILHTDELTYSVALPLASPLVAGGIVESYRRLSAALLHGLNLLGLTVESTPHAKAGHSNGPVCFEVPSNYEITANGHKLIGSAQVRRENAVLQHGTIPLTGDITRICDALAFPDEQTRQAAKIRVRERAITVEKVLGYTVTWQKMAEVMIHAFAENFDLHFEIDSLTPSEIKRQHEVYRTIYSTSTWTQRRQSS